MKTQGPGDEKFSIVGVILLCSVIAGCSNFLKSNSCRRQMDSISFCSSNLKQAEKELSLACELADQDSASCVDHFYLSAILAWQEIQAFDSACDVVHSHANHVYQAALRGLITHGQNFQRFDPRSALCVRTSNGMVTVPVYHLGTPRQPEDFNELVVVEEYFPNKLNHIYRNDGVGVPVVAKRYREIFEPYLRNEQTFAATVVLRIQQDGSPVLEIYDPLRTSTILDDESSLRLARDKSAPIADVLNHTRRRRVRAFFQPGLVKPEKEGLFMLEPYQPGKIPIVLIHGLMGDTLSWANLINELNARPEMVEQYQIWTFEFPTAEPFLRSAAIFRRQLNELLCELDPTRSDPALQEIVCVCHSMGGLVAKMQVADSGDRLWRSISKTPFENIKMPDATRNRFAEIMFFQPSNDISRIVYIGTPHQGTPLTEKPIGRVSALLVKAPVEMRAEYDQLIQDNPNAFSDEFSKRIPTSLDLLKPSSPLLQAMGELYLRPDVTMNSIIGCDRWMIGSGDSDGVVPVSSARHVRSDTEMFVDEAHAKLIDNEIVLRQVQCLLREHAGEYLGTHEPVEIESP